MRGLYLILLIISLAGLAVIDHRFKLAYFKNRVQTIKILLIAIGIFIIWDVAGIVANIFFIGQQNYLLGISVGEFPVEELFFLLLLNYSCLIIYLLFKRRIKQ